MRVMIVDDEPLARRGIALRLRRFDDVEVIAECANGPQAIEKIPQGNPDLVFLDIQMPGMSGFDVLRGLPAECTPAVIFLTAFETYALRAFQVHALDYILKPIDSLRFAEAVAKARRMLDSSRKTDVLQRVLSMLEGNKELYPSGFTVQTGSRIHIVRVEDVDWVGTAGDYVELHACGHCYLLRETMRSFEQRLDPTKFLRIHRSRIVRTSIIVELRFIDNREYLIKLSDGSEHRSSRTYAESVARWLNSLGRDIH